MNYNIEVTALFDKQLKRLIKKYPSLKIEFKELIDALTSNPKQVSPLGNDCFKIRIAIASKGKGKSGGARTITHVQVTKTKVFLLSIYDKSQQSDISDKDLKNWLKILP